MSSIVPSPPKKVTVASSPAGWLSIAGQALTFALVSASATVAGVVDFAAQTFAGVKTFTSAIIASAGIQVASIWNTNGTGASDVCVKVGTSQPDASTNPSAKIWAGYTGVGGTEVLKAYLTKVGFYFAGGNLVIGTLADTYNIAGGVKTDGNTFGFFNPNNAGGLYFVASNGTSGCTGNFNGLAAISAGFNGGNGKSACSMRSDGQLAQYAIDDIANPGARTSNNPIGRNAVAASASSVVITNSLVTAASHIIITPMENGTNNAEFRNFKVTPAAGFFTVTLSSSVTVTWPFSWRVSVLTT